MTLPPSSGPTDGVPGAPGAAPGAPGRRPRRAHARKRRHRGLKRAIVIVGTVLVLMVAAVVGYNWNLFRQIHTVDVKGLADTGSGAESGSENILMVGSTDRCSLPKSDPLYQDCVNGHTGINSDVIMILHLVASTRQVSVLSIPRDTFVPNARAEGANKIDAALVEGPSQLVAAIEDDFGIPIQHYVELNFASFADVVQAIGGVHMYFPEPVFDVQVGLLVETPGCVYLNGGDALKLVRLGELQYKGPGVTTNDQYDWTHETQSDLARIARDHEFLRVLATAVAQKGLGNPITDEQLVASLAPQVEMDTALKSHLLGLASGFHSVNADGVPELTLPIQVPDTTASYVYKGGDYGEVVYPTITDDRGADRPLPRCTRHRRHHDRQGLAGAVVGHRGGAERYGRGQPGGRDRPRPGCARLQDRHPRRRRSRRFAGRDGRDLRHRRRRGGSRARGPGLLGHGRHGEGTDSGDERRHRHHRHRFHRGAAAGHGDDDESDHGGGHGTVDVHDGGGQPDRGIACAPVPRRLAPRRLGPPLLYGLGGRGALDCRSRLPFCDRARSS